MNLIFIWAYEHFIKQVKAVKANFMQLLLFDDQQHSGQQLSGHRHLVSLNVQLVDINQSREDSNIHFTSALNYFFNISCVY